MNFDDLKNPELQEKLRAVESPKELFELAKDYGMGLSEEQLAAVAGAGDFWCWECLKDGNTISV